MRERHADDMKSVVWIHFFKTPLRTYIDYKLEAMTATSSLSELLVP